MFARLAALAVLPVLLAAAAPACATQIVTFGFTGTVTEPLLDRGLFGPPGTVAAGDPFSGRFSYEVGPGNPDQDLGDATVGRYALTDFTVDGGVAPLGAMSVIVQLQAPVPGVFPDPGVPGLDRLTIVVESPNYDRAIQLRLWGPYQTAFADDGLPTALELTDFTELSVLAGFGPGALAPAVPRNDVGAIEALFLIATTTVPEPDTLALFALALAGLGAIQRGSTRNIRWRRSFASVMVRSGSASRRIRRR